MSGLTVIPAIDLKEGRCVRLRQGRAEDVTVYSDDPVSVARKWEAEGAEWLHVVDLDGAFQGNPVHHELVTRMVEAVCIPVQVGGGIRTDDQVRAYLDAGVERVVLGTRALELSEALSDTLAAYGEHVAAGIDARSGKVQVKGWTDTTGVEAVAFARQAEQHGFATIVYTDTARDGMLRGANIEAVEVMCRAVSCAVIASGGISSAQDIRALRALHRENLVGAIVGKALYEGTVTLRELQQAS